MIIPTIAAFIMLFGVVCSIISDTFSTMKMKAVSTVFHYVSITLVVATAVMVLSYLFR